MPVEPIPCLPDGGTGTPGACNCSPSIAASPLCRPDGSVVLVVVRSPCVTCGTAAQEPAAVGWIDPATGVFTPGPPPADALPCESTVPPCVDTICRQRCDDTTGDGVADTTYSELWCVAVDGTVTLLLTYQEDPATPYVPVSPVECTYGCPERETVMLCDDTGPFLRRYTFLAGSASFEDVDLDGQTPHIVNGDVGACSSGGGLPDGPIPVTPRVFHGELLLCDDNGPFVRKLVQDAAGAVTAVVNLTLDGATYDPVPGTVRVCQPEPDCTAQSVLEACRCSDDDGDGIPETPYVELLAVDCEGAITSLGTYLPDLSAPYVPVAPMDCDAGADLGAPAVFGVQAGRVVLAPGESWDGTTLPTLQTVTARAFGGTGTVTTVDGTSVLLDGEEAAWTVARDSHARLTGPLTLTATDGTVTVTYTKEIPL